MKDTAISEMGVRIAGIRRSHKMTQETLAEMLGVTPKHISHVENATSCLSLKNLVQFCSYFNCSLDYIVLGRSSDMAFAKLPKTIYEILCSDNIEEIDRLIQYLQIYSQLYDK